MIQAEHTDVYAYRHTIYINTMDRVTFLSTKFCNTCKIYYNSNRPFFWTLFLYFIFLDKIHNGHNWSTSGSGLGYLFLSLNKFFSSNLIGTTCKTMEDEWICELERHYYNNTNILVIHSRQMQKDWVTYHCLCLGMGCCK